MSSGIFHKNYYSILELQKNCSQEEIAEAYRRLSLKYHPKVTTPENSAVFEYHFQELAEAYEVLSDPNKKNIYDIYGSEGLFNGIQDKNGEIKGKYKFLGNGHEIFEKFMGTNNPFTLLREHTTNPIHKYSKFSIDCSSNENNNKQDDASPKPIDIDLECTLEELYRGVLKTVTYKKNTLMYDLRTTEEKEASVDVEVCKGYDKNTIVTFKEMGNDSPGAKSSDLFVHIKEQKHPLYKRVNKNDLIYTQQVTLAQALSGEPVKLNTLDNRKIAVSIDEIISPSTVKKVVGEGMPIYQKEVSVRDLSAKKGDLYIKFHIIFPEYIDPAKKQEITSLLEEDEKQQEEETI